MAVIGTAGTTKSCSQLLPCVETTNAQHRAMFRNCLAIMTVADYILACLKINLARIKNANAGN